MKSYSTEYTGRIKTSAAQRKHLPLIPPHDGVEEAMGAEAGMHKLMCCTYSRREAQLTAFEFSKGSEMPRTLKKKHPYNQDQSACL